MRHATDPEPDLPLLFSGPMTIADDRWSSLSTVSHDRALVTVSGGQILLDLSVPDLDEEGPRARDDGAGTVMPRSRA